MKGLNSPFELQRNWRSQLEAGGSCYEKQNQFVGNFIFSSLLYKKSKLNLLPLLYLCFEILLLD